MKYVPGLLAGQLSGSAGSTTASRNRFGSYFRTRTNPADPQTVKQIQARNSFTEAAQLWKTANDTNRAAWEALAAQLPRVDSLGVTYYLTGFQLFCENNIYRKICAAGTVLTPPALVSAGPISTITLTATVSPTVLEAAYTPTPSTDRILWMATGPYSAGRSYFGRSAFRILSIAASAAASPAVLSTAWETAYGTALAGMKIKVIAKPLSASFLPGAELSAVATFA